LCTLCVENECVLPSIESIGRRLEDPKTYFIFYMYFYPAVVGETRWKECISKQDGRIGSNTMEAFALLVLVNNYKAWLYEEKKSHQNNLWTEYDSPPSLGKPSVVDKLLDGIQFDLVQREATSATVIYDKENDTYKKLEKERVEWLESFCQTEHCVQTNNDVLMKATAETRDRSIDTDAASDDDLILLKEMTKKKRKLTRQLREFTGVASQGKKKHKGWSDEGMVTFENYVKAIRKDVEQDKYVAWEKAYRDVIEKLGHSKREYNVPLQEERYEPNLSVVYEGF
jgi:hypothetical protein